MNVWIMNLKDNRTDKPEGLTLNKFEYCKKKGIVGIGWTDVDVENTDDTSCTQANNSIDSFEIGDIVWVNNPFAENGREKHFICKITSNAQETNNEEMNKNDIGKYCSCEYYPVDIMSNGFAEERLIAVHTIEKANETVTQKTIELLNSFTGKKNFNKKKIGIISIICICALIFGIIVTKTVGYINKKTHPILPKNLEFGMTYDEMAKCTSYIKNSSAPDSETFEGLYQPLEKKYSLFLKNEGEKDFWANYPLNIKNDKLMLLFLEFNENKEFYKVSFIIPHDKVEDTDFKVLCDYYKKAFGKIDIEKDTDGKKIAIFENKGITCTIYESTLMVCIVDEKHSSKIPEISKEAIGDALNSLKYHVSGFTMNLATLLNKCVSNMDIKYSSVYEAIYELDNIKFDDDIVDVLEDDYPEYASTSYLITVHGDICQNPDLPYMKNEDVDVIKLILIFDENENLIDHIVYDECEDLNTYAILTMF